MLDRVDRSDPKYQAIYQKLQELARSKRATTYTDIANLAGIELRDQNFGEILHEINRQEHDKDHPLLSALVTHGKGSMPGEGFFESAKRLRVFEGIGAGRREFWLVEKQRIFDYWSRRPGRMAEKDRSAGVIKVMMPPTGSKSLYATIAFWKISEEKIHAVFPAGKKAHLRISNRPGTRWYQPDLFGILKGLLEARGRWRR
jgi:alkylated DNA nucleotide flippase Atl1